MAQNLAAEKAGIVAAAERAGKRRVLAGNAEVVPEKAQPHAGAPLVARQQRTLGEPEGVPAEAGHVGQVDRVNEKRP